MRRLILTAGPTASLKWIEGVRGQDLRIDGGLLFSPLAGRLVWHQKATDDGRRVLLHEVQQRGVLNGGLVVEEGRLRLRSPFFDKRGSSPSKTGYFRQPPSEGGKPSFRTLDLRPAEWNGKTLNPLEKVDLPKRKR